MRNREPKQVLGVDVHMDRPSGPTPREPLVAVRAVKAVAASLCPALLACLALAQTGAASTPTLSWSVPQEIDSVVALNGISCVSNALCVAVDRDGRVLINTNPADTGLATWVTKEIDGGRSLTSVSCAAGPVVCVAVDDEGHAFTSTDPAAGLASTWRERDIDGSSAIDSVSCASPSSCVAVDNAGSAIVGTDPAAEAWLTPEPIDTHSLKSVACVSTPMCVAVDNAGRVLTSSAPSEGAWSEARQLDSNPAALELTSVACAAAPVDACVAAGSGGEAFASANPGPRSTWSTTPLTPAPLTAVSCQAAGLCVLLDGDGNAYVSDTYATLAPSWAPTDIDSPSSLSGVSCTPEGLCAAVDRAGHVLIGRVPRPIVTTEAPPTVSVAETAASLAGTVDTNDAFLSSCRLEYGTSEAYGQSVPCPSLGPGSAAQPVSFFLAGLTPNVTYDYRLVAVSASGEAMTANATFKTTVPPLVQPHPSISGIPAPGQRLTCKSGVNGAGASSATLSYAWLRETKGISGANGSTYLVGSADVSRHLQCRVTATNAGGSASATSAFVTVPAGGLGAISETHVGTPRVAGRTVSVAVTCSAQAAGSCTIALRLTVVETLRGSRVIAVAARRVARLGRAVAARRTSHKTVTVGTVTAHVPAGRQSTVTVALNATGRRLLKSLHKLTAKLSVSGTVIGAISAQLRSATVTLGGGAGKASSRKASTRRRR
jgi:hypothetical protein